MLKQKILPVWPLIQCEAGRAKQSFCSPGTQNGRRVIKVYWVIVRVKVVMNRAVVGNCRFYSLGGSNLQCHDDLRSGCQNVSQNQNFFSKLLTLTITLHDF